MGTIIIVVAVLEIHMDKNAVASMNPVRMQRGQPPKTSSRRRAIRRCKFQRCIANATIKPPTYKKKMWLK